MAITLSRGGDLPDSSAKSDFHNLIDNTTVAIGSGTFLNADINASASIALSKLNLANDVTWTGDHTFTSSATTDTGITATSTTLTSGDLMALSVNSADTSGRAVLKLTQDHASATGCKVIEVKQDSLEEAISINAAGNGAHFNLIGDPTVASPTDGDLWWTGTNLNFYNGSATTDLLGGLASTSDAAIKGWVNFNGTGTAAIADSYNVTSITDNGTGDYRVTWDTDFADTNYCVTGMAIETGGDRINVSEDDDTARAAGTINLQTASTADNVLRDCAKVMIMAIGDQ